MAWYPKGGLGIVLSHPNGGHSGPHAYLSAEQARALQAKAYAGEVGIIWEGVEWAKDQHVFNTNWGMRWVFTRLGLRVKKPRLSSPRWLLKCNRLG